MIMERKAKPMDRQRQTAYLLRMWRVGPEPGDWRATLENASTGQRHGFSSPQALCAWILAQTEEIKSAFESCQEYWKEDQP